MFSAKKTAVDVAVLLEEGFRNGTIVLSDSRSAPAGSESDRHPAIWWPVRIRTALGVALSLGFLVTLVSTFLISFWYSNAELNQVVNGQENVIVRYSQLVLDAAHRIGIIHFLTGTVSNAAVILLYSLLEPHAKKFFLDRHAGN